MDAGDITFAALGRLESGKAADGHELRTDALLFQLAEQIVEADAVTADHNQVCEPQTPAQQPHRDRRSRGHDFLVLADRREAVGAAERRDAAGALAHRIRGE